MSATTKVYIWRPDTGCGLTLYRKCHSHNTPGKGIITLESNPSLGTVLPAPHGKGNKCDKNVEYKRTESMHCHCGTNNRAPRWTFTDPCKPGETRCPGVYSLRPQISFVREFSNFSRKFKNKNFLREVRVCENSVF